MLMNRETEDLLIKHLRNELTDEERNALEQWKLRSPGNMEVFQKLSNEASLVAELKLFDRTNDEVGYKKLFNKISAKGEKKFEEHEVGVVSKIPKWYRVTAAAAVVVLILSAGAYFILLNKNQQQIAKTDDGVKDVEAPRETKATITLANGQKVYLDSANTGMLARQGNVKLVKLPNGQIAYQIESGEVKNEMQYNTLLNPRGSKVIDMTLADGSRVWLNAGSSLAYPIAFIGNARKVSVSGEAYFEISHDATKPFIVTKDKTSIQVLGTHFNVNAYDDEDNIKVTLIEGSVKVANNTASDILKPGQQAQIRDQINVINRVDVDAVMAWKNGLFEFDKANIKTIMKQVERWYDVEVVYEGNMNAKDFAGTVSRQENVSQVLKTLEMTGAIHFRMEGRKIVVIP